MVLSEYEKAEILAEEEEEVVKDDFEDDVVRDVVDDDDDDGGNVNTNGRGVELVVVGRGAMYGGGVVACGIGATKAGVEATKGMGWTALTCALAAGPAAES